MFAVIVGEREPRQHIHAMAMALRGNIRSPRMYVDDRRGIAACAAPASLLTEDQFDASPIVTASHCFVGSGRVDNRAELAEELSLQHRLAAVSDVELLFLAYQRWGANCGTHLAGQYSFCAVEHVSGEVTACVDHLGTVPLLYACREGVHLFATQMDSMLAHPLLHNAVPDVDATSLLVAGRIPRRVTSFQAVSSLQGGHVLCVRPGRAVEERSWWDAQRLTPLRYSNSEDYVDHARSVFGRAVQDRLRTSCTVSATVSGGLDSSLVAATAASQLSGDGLLLTMYTSVPEPGVPCVQRPGWDNDESSLVSDLAGLHANTSQVLVRPGGVNPLDIVRETHALSHTPVRNTANQVYFRAICQAATALDSRVLLTGERGNATLSPAAEVAIGRLFSRNPLLAFRLAQQDERHGGRSALRTVAAEMKAHARRLRSERPQPWHGEAFLAPSLLNRIRPMFHDLGDLRYQATQAAFATLPATFFHRDEMVHSGVEFRDPTSDKRLIEMLLALPPEAFFAGGRPRGLAREMGRGLVPDSIRLRRRRGMQVPEHCGLIARHGDAYRDALHQMNESAACRENLRLDMAWKDLERLCQGELDLRAAGTLDRMVDVGLFWRGHGI